MSLSLHKVERELKNLDFEAWVRYCFDHPVTHPEWYFMPDRDWWNEDTDPALTLSYLTRLFENSLNLLAPYSDELVNQGLWFIGSNACSSHMFVLTNEQLPVADRVRCVEAMNSLYQDVFAKRCAAHLSHLDRVGVQKDQLISPVNLVCYMWWDNLPLYGQPENSNQTEVDKTALNVMARALKLDSIACQESALHGLGHWSFEYPRRVQQTIDSFIEQNPKLRPELKTYAEQARKGAIL